MLRFNSKCVIGILLALEVRYTLCFCLNVENTLSSQVPGLWILQIDSFLRNVIMWFIRRRGTVHSSRAFIAAVKGSFACCLLQPSCGSVVISQRGSDDWYCVFTGAHGEQQPAAKDSGDDRQAGQPADARLGREPPGVIAPRNWKSVAGSIFSVVASCATHHFYYSCFKTTDFWAVIFLYLFGLSVACYFQQKGPRLRKTPNDVTCK